MKAGALKERRSHIFERPEYDHFVEPEWCSRRLFDVETFTGPILDPCCGFGHVLKSAKAADHDTWAADIVDRGFPETSVEDFFAAPPVGPADIVSNPPFDQFKPFALQALEVCYEKVALIWLVRTLPAARWLQDTPLARIWLLTPRPSMPPGFVLARGEKPGGGKQDFCWLVWDKAHKGPAQIGWLHRDGDRPEPPTDRRPVPLRRVPSQPRAQRGTG